MKTTGLPSPSGDWKRKIRLYKRGKKCDRWWETDRKLQQEIEDSKAVFFDKLLEEGDQWPLLLLGHQLFGISVRDSGVVGQ